METTSKGFFLTDLHKEHSNTQFIIVIWVTAHSVSLKSKLKVHSGTMSRQNHVDIEITLESPRTDSQENPRHPTVVVKLPATFDTYSANQQMADQRVSSWSDRKKHLHIESGACRSFFDQYKAQSL